MWLALFPSVFGDVGRRGKGRVIGGHAFLSGTLKGRQTAGKEAVVVSPCVTLDEKDNLTAKMEHSSAEQFF